MRTNDATASAILHTTDVAAAADNDAIAQHIPATAKAPLSQKPSYMGACV